VVRRYLADVPLEAAEDPLLRLIGLVDDPRLPTDLAEHHDHYLYGAPKRRR
jgi:hypothetical protein